MRRDIRRFLVSAPAGLLLTALAVSAENRLSGGDAGVALSESAAAPDAPALESIFPDGFESGDGSAWSGFEPASTLSLSNFLSWCTFSVDGGASSGDATFTGDFWPGTVVPLSAAPKPGFVWGYWIGTDGDLGGPPYDTNMTTVVTMSSDKSVTVCCPFTGQTSC